MDVSSWQPRDLSELIAEHQPQHVVVRLYLPEEKPSQHHSFAQLVSARLNGCSVGGYVWAYQGLDPAKTIKDAVTLASEASLRFARPSNTRFWTERRPRNPVLWVDCETYKDEPGPDRHWLTEAWYAADSLGVAMGIYTARWWWQKYVENTHMFWDVPLWLAQYDHDPALSSVLLFGGWERAAGKQWTNTPVDLSTFSHRVVGTRRRTSSSPKESTSAL